jgi:type IV pilus assembly protein PilW
MAASGFTMQDKNCSIANLRPVRPYHVEIYFISTCSQPTGANGVCKSTDDQGSPVPTLKRVELHPEGCPSGVLVPATSWCLVPLVEGIENLQIEYGIDNKGCGSPATYTALPVSTDQWRTVVAIRLHVLARNVNSTPGFSDTKTYQLGQKSDGSDYNFTPGASVLTYKRHAYSELVRLTNVSQRKEKPLPSASC